MAIFVGLETGTTNLDIELIKRYGVTDLDDPDSATSQKNTKFRDALTTACDLWERHTGREYASTETVARIVKKYKFNPVLNLPDPAQEITIVEKFNDRTGTWATIPEDDWTTQKLGTDRGDIDSVFCGNGWDTGLYRLTGIWGEMIVPEFVKFHTIKLATHLWKLSDNISGFGGTISMGDGSELPQDRVPWQVWDAMNRDKRASLAFRKRR